VALVLALVVDHAFGELSDEAHPVAWLGRFIGWCAAQSPRRPPARALVAGAMTECATLGLAGLVGWLIEGALRRLPSLLGIPLEACVLKQTFACRALEEAGARVERHLRLSGLDSARDALRSLVSRDRDLPASLVAAAAVESLAENSCDSIVAPLLAYALGGLPFAFVYRAANTADAMLGNRGEFEHYGKIPARIDDALNLVPARLTGVAIASLAPLYGGDAIAALRLMWRDHHLTPSPNAGWSMAAAAGALGVSLEKRGTYRLNADAPEPGAVTIARARRMVRVLSVICTLVLAGASALARRTSGSAGILPTPGRSDEA
jgi:adenosylcobinamide-phosphate synthase